MEPDTSRTISPTRFRRTCYRAALIILTLGLAAAALIWPTRPARPDPNDVEGFLSPDDAAKYQRQVEIYYGKTGVLVEHWTRAARNLTHGKGLAEAVAVVAIVSAAGCALAGWGLTRGHPR